MASATFLWAQALVYIQEHYGDVVIDTMFNDIDIIELKGDTLILYTPNAFRKEIVAESGAPIIKEAIRSVANLDVQLEILDEEGRHRYFNNKKISVGEMGPIGKEFTFETFVVGPSNAFAHAAAMAVADKPGDKNNPLLIYGPSGLGKTHLLYAIGNAIRAKSPGAKIVYLKGDDFLNEMVEAIRTNTNVEFRSKYRDADLLLMDDIHFISGKESTQDEFFHTFNTLYEHGRQIVLTSDRPPKDMLTLDDRIRTRFEWGLTADIKSPDYETRMAIIENKAKVLGMVLPEPIKQYIADNVTSNVRQLEGTINKLNAYNSLAGYKLDLPTVQRAIKDMYTKQNNVLPTPQLIISQVCSYYDVSESVIRGSARDRNTAEARQVAMYLIRNKTNLSLDEIGKEFSGKDHTTVMHSLKKVEANMVSNKNLRIAVEEIQSNIDSKLSSN